MKKFLFFVILSLCSTTTMAAMERSSDEYRFIQLKMHLCFIGYGSKMGRTVFHHAANFASYENTVFLIRYLAHENLLNRVDSKGESPLHYAAHLGRADIVKLFLQNGANPHIVNAFGETALAVAIHSTVAHDANKATTIDVLHKHLVETQSSARKRLPALFHKK